MKDAYLLIPTTVVHNDRRWASNWRRDALVMVTVWIVVEELGLDPVVVYQDFEWLSHEEHYPPDSPVQRAIDEAIDMAWQRAVEMEEAIEASGGSLLGGPS